MTSGSVPLPWRRVLAVVALALAVRLLYVFSMVLLYGTEQASDFYFMDQLARSLAAGQGYTLAGERIFNQSVGYPAVLAALYWIFGSRVEVALGLNAVLGALTAGLVYLLALRILREVPPRLAWLKPERVALLAAGLMAVYPDSLMYASLLASENLLIPLLVASFLSAFWATRNEWLAGAVTGALAAGAASAKAQVLFAFLLVPLIWRAARFRMVQRGSPAAVPAADRALHRRTQERQDRQGGRQLR